MVSSLDIPTPSEELMRRYDVAGPRYTRYPTVPEWKQDFGTEHCAGNFWVDLGEDGTRDFALEVPDRAAPFLPDGMKLGGDRPRPWGGR
jgi:hypothetical protein